jgi:hypothetical protein
MNNPIYTIAKPFLEKEYINITQNLKILLYKQNEKIFEVLNFEQDIIYSDPLLFAYFNDKSKINKTTESITYGYSDNNVIFELFSDKLGRVYLPNVGWFLTNYKNDSLVFDKLNFKLFKDKEEIPFEFEKIECIENTNIELLKYPIPLLEQCYFNTEKELLDVEIEQITKKHLKNCTKAYHLIKQYIPTQFELIEKYAPKCVIFNIDTFQRNSFATFAAQGIGFYNAYQKDYDEVFFLDDIAHQTGHAIFNVLIFDSNQFFKKDKSTILETINMPDGSLIENRDLHVIFHALYTYYTSFICLDTCLENNVFQGKQEHEAIGRIAFYLNKCYTDLLLVDNPIQENEKAKDYFTPEGFTIYIELKNKWFEMYKKWFDITKHLDMSNQPYNFTYAKFLELNPLKEINIPS